MSVTLTSAQIVPDHVAAVVARLRRFTNLTALCPDETVGNRTVRRIAARLQAVPDQDGWTGHAIVVQDAGGGGADPDTPLDAPRIDCLCYAATGYEAARLARLVVSALVPVGRRGAAFTEAQCRIGDVRQVTGLVPIYDREVRAHVRAVSFELLKKQVPVL